MAFDAEGRAVGNLISQYTEAYTLHDYVAAMASCFNNLKSDQEGARATREIANARGFALDIIGDIVGAKRKVVGAASGGFFGYYENSLALGTGDENNPDVGGILYDENIPVSLDYTMSDESMRAWIRARILVNSCARDIETTAQFIRYLFGESPTIPFTITEGYCSYQVEILGGLSPTLRAVFAKRLTQIKPAGVSILLSDSTGNIQLEVENG